MGSYKIELKKSAAKEIEKLPRPYIIKITDTIASLSADPRPNGCRKLSADEKYRIRVGVYRILYKIEDGKLIVYVVKVRHRKEVYR